MLEETIILRDIYFALGVPVPVFGEKIGVGRRMLDRYLNKNCDKVPLKVVNSAKWIYYETLGTEYVKREPLKPKSLICTCHGITIDHNSHIANN